LLGARSDTSKSQGRPLARFECPSQRTPAARTPLARTFRSVAQQELEPPAHSRLLARLSTPSPHRMDQPRVGMNLWRCSTRLSTPEPRGLDDSALDRLQLGTEDAFGSWQSGPRCSTRTADWPLIRCHEEGEGRGRVLLVQPRTRWPRWTPYTSRGKSDAARTCRFLSDDAVETSARAVATQTQTSPGKLLEGGAAAKGPTCARSGCCSWLLCAWVVDLLKDRRLGDEKDDAGNKKMARKPSRRRNCWGSRSFQLGGTWL
jgi:hypothetical protein